VSYAPNGFLLTMTNRKNKFQKNFIETFKLQVFTSFEKKSLTKIRRRLLKTFSLTAAENILLINVFVSFVTTQLNKKNFFLIINNNSKFLKIRFTN
jgi:hypothetical protein